MGESGSAAIGAVTPDSTLSTKPMRTMGLGARQAAAAAVILFVGGLGAVNLVLEAPLVVKWLLDLAIIAAFVVLVSIAITGAPIGFLVDERNKYSLSRLQLAVWTVVIASAVLAIALARLDAADPLALSVPEAVWAVLGITAAASAGSPLIRSIKADRHREPDPVEATRTLHRLGKASPAPTRAAAEASRAAMESRTQGTIVVNVTPEEATWLDLFRGDETGNAAIVDLGKIQLFLFSLLVALAYAAAIASLLATPAAEIAGLPDVSSSMATLLAISNGTYLANKVAPHGTAI